MSLQEITQRELTANGVVSMPTRPNASREFGGRSYTPAQLKEAFDRLPRLVAERYNELVRQVESGDLAEALQVQVGEGNAPLAAYLTDALTRLGALEEPLLSYIYTGVLEVETPTDGTQKSAVNLRCLNDSLSVLYQEAKLLIAGQRLSLEGGTLSLIDSDGNTVSAVETSLDVQEKRLALCEAILRHTTVTETEVEDTYTERVTADGMEVIDGAETEVISIKGNTVAGTNYLVMGGAAQKVEAGITSTRRGDGSYNINIGTSQSEDYRYITVSCGSEESAPLLEAKKTYFFHFRNSGYNNKVAVRVGNLADFGAAFAFTRFNGKDYVVSFTPTKDIVVSVIQFRVDGGVTDTPIDFDYTPSIELVGGKTEYVALFNGLKTARFVGISSYDKDQTAADTSFFLTSEVELGKWDKLNVEAKEIERRTAYAESNTVYTEEDAREFVKEQVGKYAPFVLSADRKNLAYRAMEETEEPISTESISIPRGYIAYNGGTEQIEGNGIAVTVIQTYLTPKGAQ